MVKISPTRIGYADDAITNVSFEIQPIPTRYAIQHWGKVRNYIALLKLFLPPLLRRFPITEQQIILLHVN